MEHKFIKTGFFIFFLLMAVVVFPQHPLNVTVKMKYTVIPNKDPSFHLITLLPDDQEFLQKVDTIAYSVQPERVYTSGVNKYAEFYLKDFSEKVEVLITIKMQIYRYDYSVYKKTATKCTSSELTPYLQEEKYIEVNDSVIVDAALKIKGVNEFDKVNETFLFVAEKLDYNKYLRKSVGAKRALQQRLGDCKDYSDLFVALCRAKRIPARVVSGLVIPIDEDENTDNPKHCWTEVYFKDIGWIPIDALHNRRKRDFTKMENKYIYLSFIHDDHILQDTDNTCSLWCRNIADVKEEYKFTVDK
jgi:transglutaminase-like putative cysteine protease